MGLLVLLLIGLVVGGVVFGGFMLLAFMLGLYRPEPRYRGHYTPPPKPEPVAPPGPSEQELAKLGQILFESKARDLVRKWEVQVEAGELTPDDFEDLVNQLLDAGALKSVDESYRPDRKF